MKSRLYFSFNLKNCISLSLAFLLSFSFVMLMYFSDGNVSDAVSAKGSYVPLVIIDAGHGGEDGGTQSDNGILEKDINMEICKKISGILKEKGIASYMVRDGDYLIYGYGCKTQREKKVSDIHNRMKIMKNNSDAIFLSIHQNYFSQKQYKGTQVFYSPNDPDSKVLASEIQNAVTSELQSDNTRQIKECGPDVYLINKAESTAVMVECGFMSNDEEAEKLNDSDYQQLLSESIVKGLMNYLNIKTEGEKSNGNENKKYFRVQ